MNGGNQRVETAQKIGGTRAEVEEGVQLVEDDPDEAAFRGRVATEGGQGFNCRNGFRSPQSARQLALDVERERGRVEQENKVALCEARLGQPRQKGGLAATRRADKDQANRVRADERFHFRIQRGARCVQLGQVLLRGAQLRQPVLRDFSHRLAPRRPMIHERRDLADLDEQRLGLWHGRDAEFAFQNLFAGLVLCQRGGTVSERGVQAHKGAVHFFTQRVEGVDAFRKGDGLGQFAARFVMTEQSLQHAAQLVEEWLALQQAPVRVSAFEELAAI